MDVVLAQNISHPLSPDNLTEAFVSLLSRLTFHILAAFFCSARISACNSSSNSLSAWIFSRRSLSSRTLSMRFLSASSLSFESLEELDDDAAGAEGDPFSRDLGRSLCDVMSVMSGAAGGCIDADPGSMGGE
jgi:hypothetical protein